MVNYIQGILPYLSYFDNNAKPLIGGEVAFYDNNTRQPKSVFTDASGLVPYPNPLPFLDGAQLPPLYGEDDVPYYIVAYDRNGVQIWDIENYVFANGGGSTPITINDISDNLIINGQFRFYDVAYQTPAPQTLTLLAPDSFYYITDQKGGSYTDSVGFGRFNTDETGPNASPVNYFEYICTQQATDGTQNDLKYRINDVRTLSGVSATFQFWVKSLTGNPEELTILVARNAGPGSTDIPNYSAGGVVVTTTGGWVSVPINLTPVSVSVEGTNEDYIEVIIRLPIKRTCHIQITDCYLKQGPLADTYPFMTYAQTNAQLRALDFPVPAATNPGDVYTNYVTTYNDPGDIILAPAVPIGSVTMAMKSVPPLGWLLCNGQAIGKQGLFGRLFTNTLGSGSADTGIGYSQTSISGFTCVTQSTNQIKITADIPGSATEANSGTSTFTVTNTTPGATGVRQVVTVTFGAASTITTGQYFNLYTPTYRYVIYYVKDGVYTPAPNIASAFLIRVDVATGQTDAQVRDATLAVLNLLPPNGIATAENYTASVATNTVTAECTRTGATLDFSNHSPFNIQRVTPGDVGVYYKITIQTVSSGSLNPTSTDTSYFIVYLPSNKSICFWCVKNGVGTQPTAAATYYIPFFVGLNDSADTVAGVIQTLLNYPLFQVPDMQGVFPRGVAGSVGFFQTDPGIRSLSVGGSTSGAGTFEVNDIVSHQHKAPNNQSFHTTGSGSPNAGTIDNGDTTVTAFTGSLETRPNNFSIYFIIKGY